MNFQKYSRREMLRKTGCGFGFLALASLLMENDGVFGADAKNPLAPRKPHFTPKAKRVIFLFMHGGPAHMDTFDYKPILTRDTGKKLPSGFPARFVDPNSKLLGSPFEFKQHGQSGLHISEVFPQVASMADDLCLIRSMHTNGQDHSQAVLKLHTGMEAQVRPSMGAWMLYGLGTENQNLPGFVTVSPTLMTGGAQNFGSAFLPAVYQGTPIGGQGGGLNQAQIRHIKNASLTPELQRKQLNFLQELNRGQLKRTGPDDQLEAVIESYELGFRMQAEAPKTIDISEEPASIKESYGVDQTPTDEFARQCLLARRLAEKGVRFIQVNHAFKWDQHQNLKRDLQRNASEVDQPIAALIKDLKARDMLKDTLILWGGEFGRTPTSQGNEDGRDHNPGGFTMWMAGGGVKGGLSYGATDDYGYQAQENKVHMHDLHATILHLLGLNHEKLTYRFAGRDYRLTDVHGNVVKAILG